MDLKCYLFPGWEPRIAPASAKRDWMDDAPGSFPYRCLPLSIANSHGWVILSACGFEVEWNGGLAVADVTVRADPGARQDDVPVALFGLGTFTIHVQGLIRTPPGWNIYVSGPPNSPKDGVAPLTGIIETDWAPYSFTMNWQMTRPDHAVRFEKDEPIAHFFPVQRSVIEGVTPRFLDIDEDPELKRNFSAWSRSRDAFHQHMRDNPPERPTDTWQKLYYRGLMPDGRCPVADHQTKLRVEPFSKPGNVAKTVRASPPEHLDPDAEFRAQTSGADAASRLTKYEWLLEAMNRQRSLSQVASNIYRVKGLSDKQFLDNFYALGRPAILCGAIDCWPALSRWTPEYLCGLIGQAPVLVKAKVNALEPTGRPADMPPQRMAFDRFLREMTAANGDMPRLTLIDCTENEAALAAIAPDLGRIDTVLDHSRAGLNGALSIEPANAFSPLEQELANRLRVQLVGRTRYFLLAPAETPKLYDYLQNVGKLGDLAEPDPSGLRYISDVTLSELILEPGEALFVPVGWWLQSTAVDFSASMTYTNFRWPNQQYRGIA